MADFNIDGKRISELNPVPDNLDLESENQYLALDNPSDETRKFQLKAFILKLLNYLRLKLFPISEGDSGKVLTVKSDESGAEWKEIEIPEADSWVAEDREASDLDYPESIQIGDQVYGVTKIGKQLWITSNFRNILDGIELNPSNYVNTPAACSIKGLDPLTDDVYYPYAGLLYNWHCISIINSSDLIPSGWRVANNADYGKLLNAVGGNNGRADIGLFTVDQQRQISKDMKQTAANAPSYSDDVNWNTGTNASGWAMVPTGSRGSTDSVIKTRAYFWTSESDNDPSYAKERYFNDNDSLGSGRDLKAEFKSIRLVRDVGYYDKNLWITRNEKELYAKAAEFAKRCKNNKGVFLNTSSGNDANDGLLETNPVRTFTRALQISEENNGIPIYVLNGCSVNFNGAGRAGLLSIRSLNSPKKFYLEKNIEIYAASYFVLDFADNENEDPYLSLIGNLKIVANDSLYITGLRSVESRNKGSIYLESITSSLSISYAFYNSSTSTYEVPSVTYEADNITLIAAYVNTTKINFNCKRFNTILYYGGVSQLNGDITANYVVIDAPRTELYLCEQGNNKLLSAPCACKILAQQIYGEYTSLNCGDIDIRTRFLKLKDITSSESIRIEVDGTFNVFGNITASKDIIIKVANDIQNTIYSSGTPVNITAGNLVFIKAGYTSFSRGVDTITAGKVEIYTTYSSSIIPIINALYVKIHSTSELYLSNIIPKVSNLDNSIIDITGSYVYIDSDYAIGYNGTTYFSKVSIECQGLSITQVAKIIGYEVYIKTKGIGNDYLGLYMSGRAEICAMYLNIDANKATLTDESTLIVGSGNVSVHSSTIIGYTLWSYNDLYYEYKESLVLKADVLSFGGFPKFNHILLIPYSSYSKAGQYAYLDVGVIDIEDDVSSAGIFCKIIEFVRASSSVYFTGYIGGKVYAYDVGPSNRFRGWVQDYGKCVTFLNSSLNDTTNITDDDTGTVDLAFDKRNCQEYYIALANNSNNSILTEDLKDGLTPETAVSTVKGLARAMRKASAGSSSYPVKIHFLAAEAAANTVVIDFDDLKEGFNTSWPYNSNNSSYAYPPFIEIIGDGVRTTLTLNNIYNKNFFYGKYLIVHDFKAVTISNNRTGNSERENSGGSLFVYNILDSLVFNNGSSSEVSPTIVFSQCYLECAADIRINNIDSSRMTVKAGKDVVWRYSHIYYGFKAIEANCEIYFIPESRPLAGSSSTTVSHGLGLTSLRANGDMEIDLSNCVILPGSSLLMESNAATIQFTPPNSFSGSVFNIKNNDIVQIKHNTGNLGTSSGNITIDCHNLQFLSNSQNDNIYIGNCVGVNINAEIIQTSRNIHFSNTGTGKSVINCMRLRTYNAYDAQSGEPYSPSNDHFIEFLGDYTLNAEYVYGNITLTNALDRETNFRLNAGVFESTNVGETFEQSSMISMAGVVPVNASPNDKGINLYLNIKRIKGTRKWIYECDDTNYPYYVSGTTTGYGNNSLISGLIDFYDNSTVRVDDPQTPTGTWNIRYLMDMPTSSLTITTQNYNIPNIPT